MMGGRGKGRGGGGGEEKEEMTIPRILLVEEKRKEKLVDPRSFLLLGRKELLINK